MHDERFIAAWAEGEPGSRTDREAAASAAPFAVEMHYQPIVSLRQKVVVGMEALARGRTRAGELMTAAELFARAAETGRTVEVEQDCRRSAMTSFQKWGAGIRRPLLFLNLDMALPDTASAPGDLADMARDAGLSPRRIVLEIVESRVPDAALLARFVARQRAAGFLIALDDVGDGHSNLHRVALVKPDLLKIDRALVSGIDTDYHRQEVVRSIVQLGRRIGALVVAEGVERIEETVAASLLGADYLQGYHLARPCPNPTDEFPAHLEAAGMLYREQKTELAVSERARFQQGKAVVSCLKEACAGIRPARFDEMLESHVKRSDLIDAAYVLAADGVQLSRTISRGGREDREHPLFMPADAGADHSLKDYYVRSANGGGLQVTEPYISLATGRLCITMALAFQNSVDDALYIVCVDICTP